MATALFSQHSSNPLEARSSDPRNRRYVSKFNEAVSRNATHRSLSDKDMESDDELLCFAERDRDDVVHLDVGARVNFELEVDAQPSQDETDAQPDVRESDEDEAHGANHDEEDAELTFEQVEDEDEDPLKLRSPEERIAIQQEIEDLLEAVPEIASHYKIVDRLGTGTFSSVYKAIDANHFLWDNTLWGNHLSYSPHAQSTKVYVAVKRIYVTSSPERIRNELAVMLACRDCRHVSKLITAYRKLDQVVAIMPYHCNDDFRDFYRRLSLIGIREYFRCMFRGLRDVHRRGIIHRDVKPANFLFDPCIGVGTLCDFGLASKMESTQSYGDCLHTIPSEKYPHGRMLTRNEYVVDDIKRAQKEGMYKNRAPSEKVGYPDKDTRPVSKANRAGTRGFRAPEVLFKCGAQSGAVDVWAAGIILLFFLTRKFPLFQSNDDIEALMEIATIIGRKRMDRTALLHSRMFVTNVPSVPQEGTTWREFVLKLNPDLFEPQKPDTRYFPYNDLSFMKNEYNRQFPPTSSSPPPLAFSHRSSSSSPPPPTAPPSKESHTRQVESALSLVENLLQPESIKRFTPHQALSHPFLAGGDNEDEAPIDDDEFVPHPFGEGVCGEWHFRDEVTEEPCVKVSVACECGQCDGRRYEEIRHLAPGEGIAIGRQPCEFHRNEFGF